MRNEEDDKPAWQIVKNHENMVLAMNNLFATFEQTDQLHAKKYRNNEFLIGDPVLIRNHRRTNKTDPLFIDGFVIVEKINDYTYQIKNNDTGHLSKYHVSDLKADLDDLQFLDKLTDREAENEPEVKGTTKDTDEQNNFKKDTEKSKTPDDAHRMSLRPRENIRKPEKYDS